MSDSPSIYLLRPRKPTIPTRQPEKPKISSKPRKQPAKPKSSSKPSKTTEELPPSPSQDGTFSVLDLDIFAVKKRRIVRNIVAPIHAYGKSPALHRGLVKSTAKGDRKSTGKAATCPPGDFEYDFDYGCRRTHNSLYTPVWQKYLERRANTILFRHMYTYGIGSTLGVRCNNVMEQKFLIKRSHDVDTWTVDTWRALSSGFTSVAVYGMNLICVVTMNGYLDMTRIKGSPTKDDAFFLFTETLAAEIEELADPFSKICLKNKWTISKPFAVVSVIPVCEESGSEAPSVYFEDRAIGFLKDKLSSTFTFAETIQTAISAFQVLFGKEFAANDIKMTVLEEGDGKSVKRLDVSDVTEHLGIINCRE